MDIDQTDNGRARPRPQLLRDITHMCRLQSETAVRNLVTLMNKSQDENIRLKACEAILNRAYGKPSQAVLVGEMDDTVKKVLQVEFVNVSSDQSS